MAKLVLMSEPGLLEYFNNPNPERPYVIEHAAEEFTSVCPRTGHPDFGTIRIAFAPDRRCVELKSLKIYLQGYRSEGIFFEAVTNRILDDLVAGMQPHWIVVRSEWKGRGGIRSTITATHGDVPRDMS